MIVHTVIKPNKICKERKQRKCRKIINEPGTKCEHQRKQTASEQGIMKSQQKKTPCGIKPTPILRENKAHQSFIPGKIACLLGHVEHITIISRNKTTIATKRATDKIVCSTNQIVSLYTIPPFGVLPNVWRTWDIFCFCSYFQVFPQNYKNVIDSRKICIYFSEKT